MKPHPSAGSAATATSGTTAAGDGAAVPAAAVPSLPVLSEGTLFLGQKVWMLFFAYYIGFRVLFNFSFSMFAKLFGCSTNSLELVEILNTKPPVFHSLIRIAR